MPRVREIHISQQHLHSLWASGYFVVKFVEPLLALYILCVELHAASQSLIKKLNSQQFIFLRRKSSLWYICRVNAEQPSHTYHALA